MGEKNTVTKRVMCPHCKNEITVKGTPGETISIVCPKCDTQGIFPFPREISAPKTILPKESFAIDAGA